MKCGYKYCKLGNQVDKEDGVKYKNRWHHVECLRERKNKEEIGLLYTKDVDEYVNKAMLNKSIKQVINDKKQDSEFVLYALKYAIKNDIELNNPFGLHWVVKDDKIVKSYKEDILKEKMYRTLDEIEKKSNRGEETDFIYKISKKNKNWNKVLPE